MLLRGKWIHYALPLLCAEELSFQRLLDESMVVLVLEIGILLPKWHRVCGTLEDSAATSVSEEVAYQVEEIAFEDFGIALWLGRVTLNAR